MLDAKHKRSDTVHMNKLSTEKRAEILRLMAEGMSIRAIVRVTGASKNTVTKFMVDAGCAVAEYQDRVLRNLTCKKIQCDEIWAFCYAKQKNVKGAKAAPQGAGDLWTWVAIDADTKLVPSWLVGDRSIQSAMYLMKDLKSRVVNRMQITTDGLKSYLIAVDSVFGEDVHYAQLIKLYGEAPTGDKRYSPAECVGCRKSRVKGTPDKKHVSTSFVERQNLTMRMNNRRMTRLTNAFSKKAENHAHAMALYFMTYNFVRIHQTLRVTPAMAAGVTDKLWDYTDVVNVVEEWEAKYGTPVLLAS